MSGSKIRGFGCSRAGFGDGLIERCIQTCFKASIAVLLGKSADVAPSVIFKWLSADFFPLICLKIATIGGYAVGRIPFRNTYGIFAVR